MKNIDEDEYFALSHHEDELINHRLTWLIGSQSLLFAGYALLLAVEKDKIAISIDKWVAALYWLPRLGVAISALVLVGIAAAIVASTILKHRYKRKTFGVHWATTCGGWLAALLFPVVFCIAWIKIAF